MFEHPLEVTSYNLDDLLELHMSHLVSSKVRASKRKIKGQG